MSCWFRWRSWIEDDRTNLSDKMAIVKTVQTNIRLISIHNNWVSIDDNRLLVSIEGFFMFFEDQWRSDVLARTWGLQTSVTCLRLKDLQSWKFVMNDFREFEHNFDFKL